MTQKKEGPPRRPRNYALKTWKRTRPEKKRSFRNSKRVHEKRGGEGSTLVSKNPLATRSLKM